MNRLKVTFIILLSCFTFAESPVYAVPASASAISAEAAEDASVDASENQNTEDNSDTTKADVKADSNDDQSDTADAEGTSQTDNSETESNETESSNAASSDDSYGTQSDLITEHLGSAVTSVNYDGVEPSATTGWITLQSYVPSDFTDDCYVILMNTKTTKSYGFNLYAINNYAEMLCLPAGWYVIVDGGAYPQTTKNQQFFFEPKQVQVTANTSSLFITRLRDSNNMLRNDYPDSASSMTKEKAEQKSKELMEKQDAANNGESVTSGGTVKYNDTDQDTSSVTPSPTGTIDQNREENRTDLPMTWWQRLLWVILLAAIPLTIIGIVSRRRAGKNSKNHRTFHYRIDR